eukprot:TRINITY_DN3059_c0_g1_i5.p1 TRINITY_DN3059_c0_g1~~TRINITY_DN3059_c0_g1_i5.p1  ORF type:complete len:181 (-),score=29.47 TRINITY_DN3059_c0_g1_i5:88-630(-)
MRTPPQPLMTPRPEGAAKEDEKLLDLGANTDASAEKMITSGGHVLRDSHGKNALHRSCEAGYDVIVKRLIAEQGVDVNSRSTSGRTPLHYAALWGQTDCVEILLTHIMLDASLQDSHGDSPLSLAAKAGHASVTSLLVDRLKKDNARDSTASSGTKFVEESFVIKKKDDGIQASTYSAFS